MAQSTENMPTNIHVNTFNNFLKEYFKKEDKSYQICCSSPSLADYFFSKPPKSKVARCATVDDVVNFKVGSTFKTVSNKKFSFIDIADLKFSLEYFLDELKKDSEKEEDLEDNDGVDVDKIDETVSNFIPEVPIIRPEEVITGAHILQPVTLSDTQNYEKIQEDVLNLQLTLGSVQHTISRITQPLPHEAAQAMEFMKRAKQQGIWLPQLDVARLASEDRSFLAVPAKVRRRRNEDGSRRKYDPTNLMWLVYEEELKKAGEDESGNEVRTLMVSVFGKSMFEDYPSLTKLSKKHPFRRAVFQLSYLLASSKAICKAKSITDAFFAQHPETPEFVLATLKKSHTELVLPQEKASAWHRTIRLWQNVRNEIKVQENKLIQQEKSEREKRRKEKKNAKLASTEDALAKALSEIAELKAALKGSE